MCGGRAWRPSVGMPPNPLPFVLQRTAWPPALSSSGEDEAIGTRTLGGGDEGGEESGFGPCHGAIVPTSSTILIFLSSNHERTKHKLTPSFSFLSPTMKQREEAIIRIPSLFFLFFILDDNISHLHYLFFSFRKFGVAE